VFATGGIGGVHRGAEYSFDISADLTELGRTPVLVVCAGVKSILDIPKTLEVLETQGERCSGYIYLPPSSPSPSFISFSLCFTSLSSSSHTRSSLYFSLFLFISLSFSCSFQYYFLSLSITSSSLSLYTSLPLLSFFFPFLLI
jgi:hypothetical protein